MDSVDGRLNDRNLGGRGADVTQLSDGDGLRRELQGNAHGKYSYRGATRPGIDVGQRGRPSRINSPGAKGHRSTRCRRAGAIVMAALATLSAYKRVKNDAQAWRMAAVMQDTRSGVLPRAHPSRCWRAQHADSASPTHPRTRDKRQKAHEKHRAPHLDTDASTALRWLRKDVADGLMCAAL